MQGKLALDFCNVDILFATDAGRTAAKMKQAVGMVDAGRTRAEVAAATGVVAGVTGASLSVAEGEISVLMGLSGSGKSTLLRAANGLNKVTRGQVLLHGDGAPVDLASCDDGTLRRARLERVAMVFQGFALLPWRTVRENVGLGLELRGMPAARRREMVDEKLKLVGLDAWAERYAHELSGGMQQRVGLARAFATNADILLMDEPFSALDPLIRGKLQDELLELQAKVRKTILFVSHDLDEAVKLGNRITIMEGGRIVQSGTAEDIVLHPADDYVRAFVAHLNPLTVLKSGSVMRPQEDLQHANGGVYLDRLRNYHLTLDQHGRPASARLYGEDLPVTPMHDYDPAQSVVPMGLLMVPHSFPLRLMMHLRQVSGHPVLLASDDRFAGVCDETDILKALCGTSDGPAGPPRAVPRPEPALTA